MAKPGKVQCRQFALTGFFAQREEVPLGIYVARSRSQDGAVHRATIRIELLAQLGVAVLFSFVIFYGRRAEFQRAPQLLQDGTLIALVTVQLQHGIAQVAFVEAAFYHL